MVAKDFEVHDLVWAKMKGYPFWPGKIAQPSKVKSQNLKKPQHYVYFFGTKNYAWILDELIVPHSDEMVANSKSYTKKSGLLTAVAEIQSESQKAPKKSKTPSKEKIAKVEKESPPKKSPQLAHSPEKAKTPISKKNKRTKIQKKSAKKRSHEEMAASDNYEFDSIPSEECDKMDDDYSQLVANVPPNIGYSNVAVIPPFNDDYSAHLSQRILNRPFYERPATPPIDIGTPTENLKKKKITPTDKKIGFLGLGMMGRGMVKNLLNSGHKVTVWNRTPEKCTQFEKVGAEKALSPADVVQSCDITFCCVSDPEAAKALVFGNCGILKGLDGGCVRGSKGYVEMTSIDPVTSQEIAEAITDKGGRYLEAPVSGSRLLAEEGSLLILGAGDRGLFNDCESCFFAVSKHAYYLGCSVGSGTKMNLVLSMLTGTTYAALAEAMALVDRCKLSTTNFLEILELGPLSCPLLLNKGRAMIANDYAINTTLKHQQKDLTLALSLGDACEQPLGLTAAANEIFKRAKLLRYADYDVSAVHMGAKM